MKKLLSILLITALLAASILPVSAAPESSKKEEVIYGILDEYGQIQQVYVINSFNQGSITDYGTYDSVKNLTTNDKVTVEDDRITIDSKAEKLHYQGTLDTKNLPWIIEVKYLLDGKELKADEIVGKSGKAEIKISVKPDTESDKFFYSNYTLSITVKLDERIFSDIQTQNGVIATAGMYKQITYTVLPGKNADIVIKADAKNFELDSVTFGGVRMIMDMPVDTHSITERFNELTDAIKKLDDGAKELTDAFEEYVSGLTQYTDAQASFRDGIAQLSQGISQVYQGASQLAGGLDALSQQGAPLAQAIHGIVLKTFQTANGTIQQMGLPLPELNEQNYAAILENVPELAPLKAELDGVIQLKAGMDMYTGSVTQVSQAATELKNGICKINASAATIKQYADTLTESAATLQSASVELKEGLMEYRDGVRTLHYETMGLDSKIRKEIDNMIDEIFGDADIVKSYVSDKNKSVESVQFIIKTKAIELEKEAKAPSNGQAKMTFWQRFLNLFGLGK